MLKNKDYSSFFLRGAFFFGASVSEAFALASFAGAAADVSNLCFREAPNVPRNNFPLRVRRSPFPMNYSLSDLKRAAKEVNLFKRKKQDQQILLSNWVW